MSTSTCGYDICKLCLENAGSFCCIECRTLGCTVDHLFFIETGRSYYWRIIKPAEPSKCWQAAAVPSTTPQPVRISRITQPGAFCRRGVNSIMNCVHLVIILLLAFPGYSHKQVTSIGASFMQSALEWNLGPGPTGNVRLIITGMKRSF